MFTTILLIIAVLVFIGALLWLAVEVGGSRDADAVMRRMAIRGCWSACTFKDECKKEKETRNV